MADRVLPGNLSDNASCKEAVCIHTNKIYDSCRDKDCIEELRLYPTAASQYYIENAVSVRARSAKLLYAAVDVEEVAPHYMIIVDRVNNLDTLEIQVELNPPYLTDEIKGIESLTKKITHTTMFTTQKSTKLRLLTLLT